MPLIQGKSDNSRSKNIAELIKAGHDPKQAAAIAYKTQRENEDEEINQNSYTTGMTEDDDQDQSAHIYDLNGWAEIKDNPISKVGVFPYSGSQISPDLEPDKIYKVYRPEEELSDPETIKSFKLLPWTDDHAMLGSEKDGFLPAEKKGVHGVIGEDVYYDNGYLKANLKIFSNKLKELIDNGKKELSIGYRCLYDKSSGVYNGESYDFVQRKIRGNHLASVEEGRSGHDVAVLDHFKFTFDSKRLIMSDNEMKENKEEKAKDEGEVMSLEECSKAIREIMQMMKDSNESSKEMSKEAAEEGDAKDEEGQYKKFLNKAKVEDEDNDDEDKENLSKDEDEKKPDGDTEKPAGMDAKLKNLTREINEIKTTNTKNLFIEISRRNALAEKLSNHIGTFDHSDKTFSEVAKYGIKKLGLKCKSGHEESVLEGYLMGARLNSPVAGYAKDSQVESSCIDAYLNGGK